MTHNYGGRQGSRPKKHCYKKKKKISPEKTGEKKKFNFFSQIFFFSFLKNMKKSCCQLSTTKIGAVNCQFPPYRPAAEQHAAVSREAAFHWLSAGRNDMIYAERSSQFPAVRMPLPPYYLTATSIHMSYNTVHLILQYN